MTAHCRGAVISGTLRKSTLAALRGPCVRSTPARALAIGDAAVGGAEGAAPSAKAAPVRRHALAASDRYGWLEPHGFVYAGVSSCSSARLEAGQMQKQGSRMFKMLVTRGRHSQISALASAVIALVFVAKLTAAQDVNLRYMISAKGDVAGNSLGAQATIRARMASFTCYLRMAVICSFSQIKTILSSA
jgi:hypothetical protein